MKKGIVLLGLFVLLSVSFAASLMLNSGNLNAQVQQKVLQQRRVLPVMKTSVVSVTPQKAVLTQGGEPVVVEATGTNLNAINSAQVWRAGNAVAEIEVTLDKSLLPTTLKASLKASSTAPIASDYQLAVLDSSNAKLLDVPTTVLAIEVVAPVQKAAVAQKVTTPIKAAEPVQRQVQTAPVTSLVKPGVTSVTPQKAVLTRGGEAVIVEAKGSNLTGVGSVQVTRAGAEAQGIEETLDKSQLPNTLKVSLKASAEAQVANDYQLAVFDANKQKVLDVPAAVLAIEVAAPGTKTFAAPITRKPRQQAPLTRDQMAVSRPNVASISPQKAVLVQGGDPVVVEAKGAKLDMVASARVTRAGTPIPEIEASVDRSQLPTALKVSLKASSQAPVGTDYQLAVFDTNRRKLSDVPSDLLAIEVTGGLITRKVDTRRQPVAPPATTPMADLAVHGIRPLATLEEGKEQAYQVVLGNNGDAAVENKQYSVRLEYQLGKQGEWKNLGSKSFNGGTVPGGQLTADFNLSSYYALPAGEHGFRATIDTSAVLKDRNRENNTQDFTLTVAPAPIHIVSFIPDLTGYGGPVLLTIETLKDMSNTYNRSDAKFLVNGKEGLISRILHPDTNTWLIEAKVPEGAATGPISFSCHGSADTSQNNIRIIGPPTISSFSPHETTAGGTVGHKVTILGSNFLPRHSEIYGYRGYYDGTIIIYMSGNEVSGNLRERDYQLVGGTMYVSENEIKFDPPDDAHTGMLKIRTDFYPDRIASTAEPLVILPSITRVDPVYAFEGDQVTIYGLTLEETTSVEFNGTPSPTILNALDRLIVTVPKGAQSGKIKVITPHGFGLSREDFRVVLKPGE